MLDFCVRSVIFVWFDNFIDVVVMCVKKAIFGVYWKSAKIDDFFDFNDVYDVFNVCSMCVESVKKCKKSFKSSRADFKVLFSAGTKFGGSVPDNFGGPH